MACINFKVIGLTRPGFETARSESFDIPKHETHTTHSAILSGPFKQLNKKSGRMLSTPYPRGSFLLTVDKAPGLVSSPPFNEITRDKTPRAGRHSPSASLSRWCMSLLVVRRCLLDGVLNTGNIYLFVCCCFTS